MDRLGFIGLGPIGELLSKRLVEGGFELVVYDEAPEKAKFLLNRGAAWADTPALVAQASDLVLTAATEPAMLEAFINGPSGVLDGALPGLVILNLSPVSPEMSRSLAARCREQDVVFLDASLRGEPGGEKLEPAGELPGEACRKYQPILDALCGASARPE